MSARHFIALANRWPDEQSPAQHMAAYTAANLLTQLEIADEVSALRIVTMSATEPAMRTAYLMVHNEMERGFIPVVARRLRLPEDNLTVRLCAAAVTGDFHVVDEDLGAAGPSSTRRKSLSKKLWR